MPAGNISQKYGYRLTGNQLKRIDDQGTMGINNGLLSDFKDGSNAAGTDDYTYDANGNMVKDLNKNIVEGNNNGITYSYLDKPVKIVLQNKSIVEYTYDATGEKITKKVTNTVTHSSKTTFYAGDFIYEDNVLQYVLHCFLPVYRNERFYVLIGCEYSII